MDIKLWKEKKLMKIVKIKEVKWKLHNKVELISQRQNDSMPKDFEQQTW